MEATYRVRIVGRLLDDQMDAGTSGTGYGSEVEKRGGDDHAHPMPAASKTTTHRLSHFFRALSVDFPSSRGPEQSVEWKKPDRTQASSHLPAAADFDELTFKRTGDENMNITIHLHRHEDPERFLLSPELQDVIDMKEATRQEAVMGLWEYIKASNLQEDEEKRNFRCDDLLRKVRFIPAA
jgi:SWI/SNF-related matrix-associated actin-dependent regulator of chromatin subfamily D